MAQPCPLIARMIGSSAQLSLLDLLESPPPLPALETALTLREALLDRGRELDLPRLLARLALLLPLAPLNGGFAPPAPAPALPPLPWRFSPDRPGTDALADLRSPPPPPFSLPFAARFSPEPVV